MHLTALQGLCLVPAVLLTMPPDVAKEKVLHFAQMYKEDLDSSGSVQSELHSWRTKWMQKLITSGQQFHGNHSTTADFPHVCKLSYSAEDPLYHASNNVHF